MADVLTIWNLALLRVGEAQTVNSPNETTEPARLCRQVYDPARQSVLRDFDWAFARRTGSLVADSSKIIPAWNFSYALPAGTLAIRSVSYDDPRIERLSYPYSDEYRERRSGIATGATSMWRSEWERHGFTGPDGKEDDLIVSNQEMRFCVYTRDIADASRFPPDFIDGLAWRMGMDLAMVRTRQTEIRQMCWQSYMATMNKAETQSEKERRLQAFEPDMILARR